MNGNSYIRVDDDVRCYNEDNTLQEDVIDTISSKHPCLDDGSDSDNYVVVKITHAAARHSKQVLQQYFIE